MGWGISKKVAPHLLAEIRTPATKKGRPATV
jgi:hypothetical protein